MKLSYQKILTLLCPAAAALFLSGCGSGAEAKAPGGGADAPDSVGESVMLAVEKPQLKFGFIKLTDCAPLVIAKEKGFFEDEGLIVEIEAQANWKVLLDRVITGELDGAHMLAGQPIAATVGFGTKADFCVSYSLDYNGNGITVSNEIWSKMRPNVAMGRTANPCIRSQLTRSCRL